MVTDVSIKEVTVSFTEERFRTPLILSTGPISEITCANVRMQVENRRGEVAEGRGGILLSDLWAFPSPEIPHQVRDQIMLDLVCQIADTLRNAEGYYDPLQLAHTMENIFPDLGKK